jgi:serine protease
MTQLHHIPSRAPLLATTAALLGITAMSAHASELRSASQPIKDQYIVVLKDTAASLDSESRRATPVKVAAKNIAEAHRAKLTHSFDRVLRGFVVRADGAALARLLADPRVAYIQEDGLVAPSATQSSAPWGLDRIDQNALPLSGTYTYENVVMRPHVYIIDTGVLAGHTQFTGRMGNGVSFIADGLGTSDCNGHGTHVAGIAAGTTWGVAKNAIVHPGRIAGCSGLASFSNLVAGMDWVAANRIGPAVANLSYNATHIVPTLDTAATNLINSGVTLVVAAGNQNVDACQFSPGRVPGAITVGSTASNDTKAFTSAIGPCLDVFAPGVAITSSYHRSTTDSAVLDGTSMAAPHVAGAIARYINIYPATTPAQMSSVLIGAATPNVVIAAGAGSPNRLLYIPELAGMPPAITSFICPDYTSSGGGTYWCQVAYSSATPATIRWPSGAAGTMYNGTCGAGARPTVSVTVSNAYGSVSRSSTFNCPTGAIP